MLGEKFLLKKGIIPFDKPWPDPVGEPINWTPERLKWWAEGRARGIQYFTGFGPVYCPPQTW